MKNYRSMLLMIGFMLVLSMSVFANDFEYWREESNTSNVWVNVSIPTSGSITLVISNVTGGTPDNGSAVFELFDDFNDASIDSVKWNTVQVNSGGACNTGESGGIIWADSWDTDGSGGCNNGHWSNQKFGVGYAWESYGFMATDTPSNTVKAMGWGNSSSINSHQALGNQRASAYFYKSFNVRNARVANNTAVIDSQSGSGFGTGNFRYYGVNRLTNETSFLDQRNPYFTSNESLPDDMQVFLADQEGVQFGQFRGRVEWSWTYVRKIVYNEPTINIVEKDTDFYEITITNNEASDLEGYAVRIPFDNALGGNLTVNNQPVLEWLSTSQQFDVAIGDTYDEEIHFTKRETQQNISISTTNGSLVLNNQSSANFSYTASQLGIYTANINISDIDDAQYSDEIVYTFNVTQPPIFNESLVNGTLDLKNHTFTLNVTSDYAFVADVNDTHVQLAVNDETKQVEMNFTPDYLPLGVDYHLAINVSNADGFDTMYVYFYVATEPELTNLQFNDTAYYGFEDMSASVILNVGPGRGNANVSADFKVNGISVGATPFFTNISTGTQLNYSLANTYYSEFDNVSFEAFAIDDAGSASSSVQILTTILEDTQCFNGDDDDGDTVTDLADTDCDGVYDDSEFGTVDNVFVLDTQQQSSGSFSSSVKLDDVNCKIEVFPAKVLMTDDRRVLINITNNDKTAYTPVMEISGDENAIDRLKIEGELGTILRSTTKTLGVKYSSSIIGIPVFPFLGDVTITLKHDRCNDVVIPIEMMIQGLVDEQPALSITGEDLALQSNNAEQDTFLNAFKEFAGTGDEFVFTEYIGQELHSKVPQARVWMLFSLMALIFGIYLVNVEWFKNQFLNIVAVVLAWGLLTLVSSMALVGLVRLI